MAVEINIDLDSTKAHGKIDALEARLKAVRDKVDIDFDIDDDLKDSIQKLTDELKEIEIDVDYKDLEKAAALKAMIQGDIEADLNLDTDKTVSEIQDSLDPPDGSGIDHDGQAEKFSDQGSNDARFSRFLGRFERMFKQPRTIDGGFAPSSFRRDFLDRERGIGFNAHAPSSSDRISLMQDTMRRGNLNKVRVEGMDFDRSDLPNLGGDSGGGGMSGLNARRRGTLIGRFKKKLRALVPSMSTFYTIFAAVLPLMAALGTQLAGVAASMGSVAIAGGAMLALGLVGHGEDMASSWQKAKEQMQSLKQEMFETFQPTMQTFAPIQDRFFDMAPEQLNRVAKAMEGLTVFSSTLFEAFRGGTQFLAEFFRLMISHEGIMSQLTMRFGQLIGEGILDFFSWLVEEAYNSQNMIIKLGGAFADLLSAFYHFSKVIARIVMAFRPLAGFLSWLGRFLDNKLVVAILTFVATLLTTIWVVTTLTSVTAALASVWAGGLIATIISSTKLLAGYIFRILASVTANYALAASIANVVAFATMGIGALLGMAAAASAVNGMNARMGVDTEGIGGGVMPSGGNMGGGGAGSGTTQTVINQGDTYNMEVNGDVDNATEQGLKDMIASEGSVSDARTPPSVGG